MRKYLVTLGVAIPLLVAWPEAPLWIFVMVGLAVGASCARLDRRKENNN